MEMEMSFDHDGRKSFSESHYEEMTFPKMILSITAKSHFNFHDENEFCKESHFHHGNENELCQRKSFPFR